jgi:hypothetical protein
MVFDFCKWGIKNAFHNFPCWQCLHSNMIIVIVLYCVLFNAIHSKEIKECQFSVLLFTFVKHSNTKKILWYHWSQLLEPLHALEKPTSMMCLSPTKPTSNNVVCMCKPPCEHTQCESRNKQVENSLHTTLQLKPTSMTCLSPTKPTSNNVVCMCKPPREHTECESRNKQVENSLHTTLQLKPTSMMCLSPTEPTSNNVVCMCRPPREAHSVWVKK